MQHKAEDISLTSAEIAYLWNSYILNSKAKYLLMYFTEKAQDQDIKAVLKSAANMSEMMLEGTTAIYNSVGHPIPHGFREDDVRVGAEKLYSDALMLHILKQFTTYGLANYGLILSMSARADVRAFFNTGILDTIDLLNNINDIALGKGLFIRTPYIPIAKTIEFAQSKRITGAIFGHKRPMTSMEIACIFDSSLSCSITQAFFTGLAQVSEKESVRNYVAKGRKLLREHIDTMNNLLIKEELTIPPTFDTEVLNTKDIPFSDKAEMYAAFGAIGEVLFTYGAAKTGSLRKDISLIMTELSAELSIFLKDGLDITIDNGWLEEIPKNIDREDLIELKKK